MGAKTAPATVKTMATPGAVASKSPLMEAPIESCRFPEAADLAPLVTHDGQEGVADYREGRHAENGQDEARRRARDDGRARPC
jgi:hypothetical protein